MKVLVFAHVPPPHHGQSYMVQLLLQGFGGDRRGTRRAPAGETPSGNTFGVECYHVNARLSKHLEDIGDFRPMKLLLLLGYCLQAIYVRFRYGVTDLYYVPAPGKRSALYRDWMVMGLCRPFFRRVILHWHAAGLAKWLETAVQMRFRALTFRLMKDVDLSIVLSRYNRADAEKLFPRRIRVVHNGIPDPCPHFDLEVRPRRRARFAARRKLLAGQALRPADLEHTGGDPQVVKVLYLAHCTREKGLFDTVAAVQQLNARLAAERSPLCCELVVTGNFVRPHERDEFERLLADPAVARGVRHVGFVGGKVKEAVLREADVFCFPTYYENENQPVNLIEAMAFGLPIVTTRWRSLPEMLPAGYAGLVDVRAPEQVAAALMNLLRGESGEAFRDIFLRNFTLEHHLKGLAEALHSVEGEVSPDGATPAVLPVR